MGTLKEYIEVMENVCSGMTVSIEQRIKEGNLIEAVLTTERLKNSKNILQDLKLIEEENK